MAAFLAMAGAYVFLGMDEMAEWPPPHFDGEGYYAYLPLAFIEHTADVAKVVPTSGDLPYGASRISATGHWNIKYPIGTAIAEAPCFFLVHAFCRGTGWIVANGYTLPYRLGIIASGLIAAGIGLHALGRWLARRFSAGATAFALIGIALGTNLVHYATFEADYAHIYGFAAVALLLNVLDWYGERPGSGRAALAGALVGYLFLVRNTDLLFASLLLLPVVTGKVAPRIWLIHMGAAGAAAAAMALPQLALWKYSLGSWLAYSYVGETFDFAHPVFGKVFWSWQKGVFVHFPFLLAPLIGLIGLVVARRGGRTTRIEGGAALLCGGMLSYIVASWYYWSFAGSCGHRAFVDFYPLAALGLAWVGERLEPWRRVRVGLLAAAVLYAQAFILLYWCHFISQDAMTQRDFAALPKVAATKFPAALGLALYDGAFDLRYPGNTSSLSWREGTAALLTLPGDGGVKIENTGKRILKDKGHTGNVALCWEVARLTSSGEEIVEAGRRRIPSPLRTGESLRMEVPNPKTSAPGAYRVRLWLSRGGKDSLAAAGLANQVMFGILVRK